MLQRAFPSTHPWSHIANPCRPRPMFVSRINGSARGDSHKPPSASKARDIAFVFQGTRSAIFPFKTPVHTPWRPPVWSHCSCMNFIPVSPFRQIHGEPEKEFQADRENSDTARKQLAGACFTLPGGLRSKIGVYRNEIEIVGADFAMDRARTHVGCWLAIHIR